MTAAPRYAIPTAVNPAAAAYAAAAAAVPGYVMSPRLLRRFVCHKLTSMSVGLPTSCILTAKLIFIPPSGFLDWLLRLRFRFRGFFDILATSKIFECRKI